MKRWLITRSILALALWPVSGEAQQTISPTPQRSPDGRFQLFFSPHLQADTYLGDTVTGRIWQQVVSSLNGDPSAFEPVDVIDESGRNGMPYAKMVEIYGKKQT